MSEQLKNKIYSDIYGGVTDVAKEFITKTDYKIADFYDDGKVKTALKDLKLTVEYDQEQESKQIHATLLSRIDQVKRFFSDHLQDSLTTVTEPKILKDELSDTDGDIKTKWGRYFKRVSRTFKTTERGLEGVKDTVDNVVIEGYEVKDLTGLKKAISELPKKTSYGIEFIRPLDDPNLITNGFDVLLAIDDLVRAVGIEPKGNVILRYSRPANGGRGDVELMAKATEPHKKLSDTDIQKNITGTHHLVRSYLIWTLYSVKQQADSQKPKKLAPANIDEELDGINYISRPPIENLYNTLLSQADDENIANTLGIVYRTEKDREQDGGLPITIKKDDQQTIWDLIDAPVAERGDLKNILKYITSLTLPAFFMLNEYLQDDTASKEKIKILDLMRVNPRFSTDKALTKGVKPEHKQAFIQSLILLQNVNYSYRTLAVDKRGKRFYKYDSVKVYDYTIVTDSENNITHIENLKYTQEFLDKMGKNIGLVYGSGFYNLTYAEHQRLAIKIYLEQVKNEAQLKKTTAGKPIEITAQALTKDIYKSANQNTTQAFKYLTGGLNELEKVGEISKWHTANNDQTITGNDEKSQHLYIYPSKHAQRGNITKAQRNARKNAKKQTQAERAGDLKKLIQAVKNDLTRPDDKRRAKEYVAQDLTEKIGQQITEEQINLYLLKPTKTIRPDEISDDVADRITELLGEYE